MEATSFIYKPKQLTLVSRVNSRRENFLAYAGPSLNLAWIFLILNMIYKGVLPV